MIEDDIFKELKIKDQLLYDHEWLYIDTYNSIYYMIDKEHSIVINFKGYPSHTDGRKVFGNWTNLRSELRKRVRVDLCRVSFNPRKSLYINDIILTKSINKYSLEYLLIRKLEKIRAPIFKSFQNRKKAEEKETEKFKHILNYKNIMDRIPTSMKRDITIDKILENE